MDDWAQLELKRISFWTSILAKRTRRITGWIASSVSSLLLLVNIIIIVISGTFAWLLIASLMLLVAVWTVFYLIVRYLVSIRLTDRGISFEKRTVSPEAIRIDRIRRYSRLGFTLFWAHIPNQQPLVFLTHSDYEDVCLEYLTDFMDQQAEPPAANKLK